MLRSVSVFAVLCLLLSLSAQAQQLTIRGATVVDVTDGALRPDQTVLVEGDCIAAVGPAGEVEVPGDAAVIDASGRYIVPGFADMHVHFGSGGLEPQDAQTLDRALRQFLFYGVTTVFSVGGTGGHAASIEAIRSRAASGDATAPHVYATGSMLTLPGSHPVATIMRVPPGADSATYDWSRRGVALVETPAEARAAVRANAKAGMDAIKIVIESGPTPFGDDHPQMPPAMIAAVVEEASSFGLSVGAHVSSLDELEDATAGDVRAVMHAAGEPFPGPEHWAQMRERGIFYVPTLSLFAPMAGEWWGRAGALDDPFLRAGIAAHTLKSMDAWQSPMASMPEALRAQWWKGLLASIGAAHEAGVPIMLGTDPNNPFVFPGYSVHVELELLVEAGLTPMEALVAATRRPAEMLGRDNFGAIEPGKRADLLILGANPLVDIRNTRTLETVIHGGDVIDRSALFSEE